MPIGLIAAGVGAAGAIGSAVIGSSAAKSASETQANAENTAAADQLNMYNQTKASLAPYNTTGLSANQAISEMPAFNFAPTEANLENTPGYQFNLYQGLKATQNSAAARGLGVSGAAEKGAASYASGLANSTYQNQFQNALSGYTTNLNKLQTQAGLGENAAAMTGNYGTQTAQAIGQTAVGAANAQAAGQVGSANAISNGLNGAANSFLTGALFNNGGLYGGASAYNAGLGSTFSQAGADQYGFDGSGYASFAGS